MAPSPVQNSPSAIGPMFQNALDEFKEFAVKGSALDLAIGVVLGAAFTGVVNSITENLLAPLIGAVTGVSNLFLIITEGELAGPYVTLAAAQEAGAATLSYGLFFDAVINFLLAAIALFVVVKGRQQHAQNHKSAGPAGGPR